MDELKGRGYYYPTVEFVEPFASWLTTYAQSWGDWLSTEESWNNTYYDIVASDPDWGLTKGWYEDGANWSTFNDFFSRRLSSPEVRPIADADVVAPADSWPKDLWTISDDNQLIYPANLQIKTAKLSDIGKLIGQDSEYHGAFAGGTLTHTFLDVNDYHRYHSPVSGTLREPSQVWLQVAATRFGTMSRNSTTTRITWASRWLRRVRVPSSRLKSTVW